MDRIIAVVLCGGAGTRLFPLTEKRSKPAVPLLGKYRLVDIPVSNCLHAGINRVYVLTQYNSAGLNQHITDTYRMGAFSGGFVSVLNAEQTPSSTNWNQGTADAVRQIFQHLEHQDFSHLLILSGDQLYQMDYMNFYEHHRALQADISVATTPVTREDASAFGIMQTNGQDEIVLFQEKPPFDELSGLESNVDARMAKEGRVFLASTGIYLFNRDVLHGILTNNPDAMDFGKEVIPQALGHRNVVSYPFEGYWSDVGSMRSYHAANMALAQASNTISFYDESRMIYTKQVSLPPAKIQNTFLQDVIVSEGSQLLQCRVYSSVLGVRTYIGPRTTVKNSVIMGAEYFTREKALFRNEKAGPDRPGIGQACYIENAILDVNVCIQDGVVLANQDGVQEGEGEGYYIRDGIIVIPSNTTIPAGTVIGSSSRFDLAGKVWQEFAAPAMPVGLAR